MIFQKINFRITYFFWRVVFLEQLLFQKTLPSIAATFLEELLSYNHDNSMLQHNFWEELLFRSYDSFPQFHFLFIR